MIHPARKMPFAELHGGLEHARQEKLVRAVRSDDGLTLYCYTEACVYDRKWTEHALLARGLILDDINKRIVATPFPKFFNVSERGETIPSLSFETFEKLDGSLIVIWHHGGRWRASTKGSFYSSQAKWAQARLDSADLSSFIPGHTYLAEAIYPENRIVVHYGEEAMVLLGAYHGDGRELSYAELIETATALKWRAAKRHQYQSVAELLAVAQNLSANEEGFVIRFSDATRLKIKGDEYRRIHALVSRLTPLAMWEAMLAGDDMEKIRRDLPEEFWGDFDKIVSALESKIDHVVSCVAIEANLVSGLSDKDVGLRLEQWPDGVRQFIFSYRKNNGDLLTGRARAALFRYIRPTGNMLDGYVPSYAINRVIDEST